MKNVWIVGATSHVAKSLINHNFIMNSWAINLIARSPDKVEKFYTSIGIGSKPIVHGIDHLAKMPEGADAIINCIGFGTPEKIKEGGAEIFMLSERIDNLILTYLERSPKTTYINFSSGAVYGSALECPVDRGFIAQLELSPLKVADYYRISKIYQEAKHRALQDFSILDIRLFSFFSRFIDSRGGYFLTDIIRALSEKKPLLTTRDDIYRDYIAPGDLYDFVSCAIGKPFINTALDTFSARPVSKMEILDSLSLLFGLQVEYLSNSQNMVSPTGIKAVYYSCDRTAENILNYVPKLGSMESIISELTGLGFKRKL